MNDEQNVRIGAVQAAGRKDIKVCLLLLVLVVGAMYGACQNGQWVPGGSDDALYLCMARDMLRGQPSPAPVAPLWPLLLAGAMAISPSFWLLNGLLMAMMLGAVGLWYFVVRHWLSPRPAFFVMLGCAVLFEWHRFSFTHYGEALFYLLLGACVLLAIQISSRPALWRIALLMVLCIIMAGARGAAVLAMPLIALPLLEGSLRPRFNRQWIAALLVCLCLAGTFLGTRWWMRQALQTSAAASSPRSPRSPQAAIAKDELKRDTLVEHSLKRGPKDYAINSLSGGNWVMHLLWPPTVAAKANKSVLLLSNIVGWLLIALYCTRLPAAWRSRQWLWLAVPLYLVILAAPLNYPIPRYLAPAAPLLLAGLWAALDKVIRATAAVDVAGVAPDGGVVAPQSRRPGLALVTRVLAAMLLGSIVVCNGAILAGGAYVAQSPRYVQLCQAGEYAELMAIRRDLLARGLDNGQLAVSVEYNDLQRKGASSLWAWRFMTLMTDRRASVVPTNIRKDPTKIATWAQARGTRYVLMRPPQPASRIWHVRMSCDPAASYYALYRVENNRLVPVEIDDRPVESGLRRVPGL